VYLSYRRVGCGYVFDSSKISIEDAKKEYMQNNGHRKFLTDFRVLEWEPGRLKTPWQDNTVAVGLSAGFIEPMEANGLSLLIHQIKTLSRVIGKPRADVIYNRAVAKVFDQVADFIWHHYACTTRQETSFWQHYAKLDGKTTLMKRIQDNTNLKTNLYPSYVYAYLAIYYGSV
jgi:tryptophan halogenase